MIALRKGSNDKHNDDAGMTWGRSISVKINTVRRHLGKLKGMNVGVSNNGEPLPAHDLS